jgi:hypothetical protein
MLFEKLRANEQQHGPKALQGFLEQSSDESEVCWAEVGRSPRLQFLFGEERVLAVDGFPPGVVLAVPTFADLSDKEVAVGLHPAADNVGVAPETGLPKPVPELEVQIQFLGQLLEYSVALSMLAHLEVGQGAVGQHVHQCPVAVGLGQGPGSGGL